MYGRRDSCVIYRKLNYHTVGGGDNIVVFLHGWGASIKSFEKVAMNLSNCKSYLIDLYGFGQTAITKPMDQYVPHQRADAGHGKPI